MAKREWTRIAAAGLVTAAVLYAIGSGRGEPEPPAVTPTAIDIPALEIKAPLIRLGLVGDGEVELPPYSKPKVAGWFELSAVPGDGGASVVIGHVDTKTAPAVFYRLKDLRKGAVIRVSRSDGKTVAYRVDSVERVHKDRFPAKKVYGGEGLRLVTCGGAFDQAKGEYEENLIVYAAATAPRKRTTL
ncbi:class F sortase [Rhizohabitans arisaemae]|uniref:class F sortase n=1 Tax=Rhizohabitans arisaemae TaxID=2720610 RepID=UPI0024B077FC|nr:class F sortase [Rhizohabitans arisaemae]